MTRVSARPPSCSSTCIRRQGCQSRPLAPISRRRRSWLTTSKWTYRSGTLQDRRSSSPLDMPSTVAPTAVPSFSISQTRRASIHSLVGKRASCRTPGQTILRPTPLWSLATSLIRRQIARSNPRPWDSGAERMATSLTMRHQPLKTSQWTTLSLRWQS